MPFLWLATAADIFIEFPSVLVGKRGVAFLCSVSPFVTDLGCHLVQVSFPFEELSKTQVVILSLLPK